MAVMRWYKWIGLWAVLAGWGIPAGSIHAQRLTIQPSDLPEEPSPAPELPQEKPLLETPVFEEEKLEGFYNTRAVVPHKFKEDALEANRLVGVGQLEKAAVIYRKILEAYPESLFGLSNLAVVEFRQGKFGPAAKKLEVALKNAPEDAFSHSVLGICYYQMGKLDLAVKALNRSISIDPGDARTRNYMAIVASQKGWWRAAEAECKRAIELDPDLAESYYNLATVYAHRPSPDYLLARDFYAKALKAGYEASPELEKRIGFK
jgi:tetratricopeptide (TPR) repeat protein